MGDENSYPLTSTNQNVSNPHRNVFMSVILHVSVYTQSTFWQRTQVCNKYVFVLLGNSLTTLVFDMQSKQTDHYILKQLLPREAM